MRVVDVLQTVKLLTLRELETIKLELAIESRFHFMVVSAQITGNAPEYLGLFCQGWQYFTLFNNLGFLVAVDTHVISVGVGALGRIHSLRSNLRR